MHAIFLRFISIFLLCYFISFSAKSQRFIDKLLEKFEFPLNQKRVKKDSSRYPAKLVIAPVISFEPATNWGAGIGAKILFKFKKSGEETRTSNLPISALYTLNNQIIFGSGYTIFFNQEKWYLTGNLGFSKFPQSYYGTGRLSLNQDEEIFAFVNYLIEPLLLKKVHKKLFVGGGIRYNIITNTEVEPEGSLQAQMPSGYDGSNSAGLELAAVWDSRDNVLNAHKGSFVEFKQGFYENVLGGTHQFRFNQLDARTYIRPWAHRQDVIALHLLSRFAWGDVPLAELSILGGAENARGYQEGRYRDLNAIATQVEYRWQAGERIGFVFFAEMGDVFQNAAQLNARNLKYGLGAGLRFKIVKKENLNIRFDYGLGLGHQFQNNYYLGIAEAF